MAIKHCVGITIRWIISHFIWQPISPWICSAFCWHPHSSLTKASCKRLSYLFLMATESHYLFVDWWSLPPNKQLPHYPPELHPFTSPPSLPPSPPLPSLPLSILSRLIQSSVDSFCVGCSSATASIIHTHLLCVQLLDLLPGGKSALNDL